MSEPGKGQIRLFHRILWFDGRLGREPSMSASIAVDVGGTFTDLVSLDSAGCVSEAKSLTTPDDQILLRMPGGGGYGDPLDRDPDLVCNDIREELLSAADAASVYGVVIAADDTADQVATAQLRKQIRHASS